MAFEGFESGSGVWFPLITTILLEVGITAATFERALLPDIFARWDEMVASGRMEPAQVEQLRAGMTANLTMRVGTIGSSALGVPLLTLLMALLLWFVAGFLLGGRFGFSRAWAVAAWSWLVLWPGSILRGVLAWAAESFQSVHLGLGVLVPTPEEPSKLFRFLTVLLDALSPFSAWWLVVIVFGVAAVSGLSRRKVGLALTLTYLFLAACGAALAALLGPGA